MKDLSVYDCTYCGMMAEARDHVIPHSYENNGHKRDWSAEKIVPACKECNSLLSNKWLPSIAQKAEYLAVAIRMRYKKALSAPDWREEDILELGKTLRSFVRKEQRKKKQAIARIAFAEHVATLQISPEDVWKVQESRAPKTETEKLIDALERMP